jgi:CelD/BcsL family acetyltransferase involved in cellulose biosynthesis
MTLARAGILEKAEFYLLLSPVTKWIEERIRTRQISTGASQGSRTPRSIDAMKIDLMNVRELTPAHWEAWREIREGNSELDSAYFSPEFMRILGAVRNDAFVAVLRSGREIRGFFPHQRRRFGRGLPAGGCLSDFHGLVAPADTLSDVHKLMYACGLVSWDFHALVTTQPGFVPYHAGTVDSHYLDTASGLQGYEAGLRKAGSSQPRKLRAFRRKAGADFKKVEFVEHVTDADVLDKLFEWKSQQYRASGLVDKWSYKWMRAFVRRIHATQSDDFAGMLSALYFDGELAGLHMGMRSGRTWHWWFPRHSQKFAKYFPGVLLLYFAIERAPQLGISRIDLGYGDEEFKLRLRSGAIPVAHGRIEIPSVVATLRRYRVKAETWVRRMPVFPLVRIPGRAFTRWERWNRDR